MDSAFWTIALAISVVLVSHARADNAGCQAATCLNGGTCHDDVNTTSCTCVAGYTGGDCGQNIDDCVPDACKNGGTCNDELNGYSCTCAAGYTGDDCDQSRLIVQGNYFLLNNQTVFLSGGNLPWIHYGYDFGDHQWARRKSQIEYQIRKIHLAGGNSIRLWVHIQGETTPAFDDGGFVTAPDHQGTLLDDIEDLLDTAQKYDVLVFPTLWNCAVGQDDHNRLDGLIVDSRKLQSYIDKVLKPMATKVKGHPALGGWDILNEPEGMIKPDEFSIDKCFDTRHLHGTGTGWAGGKYTYQDMLRFINWQADAIKAVDSGALVTLGSWNPKSNTDSFGQTNHYSDACLRKAGGRNAGVLDFYSLHSHSWHGNWDSVAAFVHRASDYGLHKPIVVGEFWEQRGGHMSSVELFDYVYNHGYAGAWSWDLVHYGHSQRQGMAHIKDLTDNGRIDIDI